MQSASIYSMYRMVCSAPDCGGIVVEPMPELLEHDQVTNFQSHTHLFYEIIWFQESGGVHTVDFQDYPVEANMLFFLTPGQVHRFDGQTRHKGYSIKICSDFFDRSCEDSDLIRYSVFHVPSDIPYATLDGDAVAVVQRLVQQMQNEQESHEFGHQEMLRLLARILLIEIRRFARQPDNNALPVEAPAYRLFIRFRRMLEEEYNRLHLVSEYAERLNVSTKTLTNAVRLSANQAPLAFINDRITLEAKRLLRFSNLMVKEIAYHLGFDDPSNFVKFFKRQTGYLPGDFQKQGI